MDVLWFRVPMPADAPADVPLGTIDGRGMVVAIPRAGYWQCARIIEKGGFPAIAARGIAAFRADIVALVPGLAAGLGAIAGFADVNLISVPPDRPPRRFRPRPPPTSHPPHPISPA